MPHTILFVDDEPEVLAILRRFFGPSDGHEVLTAAGGKEALEILAARPVDLLVTDQRMPGMTGVELIAAARRTRPDLCAILLTAYTDPRDVVSAINQGEVYRYVTKPWDAADLQQTVARALEQVQLKRDRELLTAQLERRLAALQAASDIAREAGGAEGPSALAARMLARLPAIVPCDVAAALLAPPGDGAVLHVRPVAPLGSEVLDALRDAAAAAFAAHAGRAAAPLEVRVTGAADERRAPAALAARLTVPVLQDGAAVGVVVLGSAHEGAFDEGDARVLDVLVNEMGEALRSLSARLGGERRRLERVVESLADGLVFAPAEGPVVANPAARRMLGAAEDAPLGPGWLDAALGFSPRALLGGAGAGAPRAVAGPEIRRGERALAPIVSAVPEGGGPSPGVAVVLRDVTEQRQLEARKEEFVHVVTHELRTPLTAITGVLDLVVGGLVGPLEAKQERYLRMARESADRLSALVDDILDVARLARGKLGMEPEPIRLDEVVRQSVERYQAVAAERGLDLDVDLPAAPARVIADPGRVGQVLANLLTNAVKFAPARGVIRVRLFRSPAVTGLTGVSIWNDGEAIPERDLERVFEKFEQVRSAGSRRARGTGLGLAICRGIVEAHGGRIWAESAPGEGVRLVFVLPDEAPAAPPEPAEAGPHASEPCVVVADEPDAAALARAALEARGLRCRAAAGAADAVALVRRLRPRVVVWNPGHRPVAAVGEVLRDDPDARGAALLGFAATPDAEAALRAGAAAVVERPCAPADLAAAAHALLARRAALAPT